MIAHVIITANIGKILEKKCGENEHKDSSEN